MRVWVWLFAIALGMASLVNVAGASAVGLEDGQQPQVHAGEGTFDGFATEAVTTNTHKDPAHSTRVILIDVHYEYVPVCADEGTLGVFCRGRLACVDKSLLYTATAQYSDGSTRSWDECLTDPPAGVAPTPTITMAMVRHAFEQVPLPVSEVQVQPPGGETLVNLATIYSTEAEDIDTEVILLGRRVELRIRASAYAWNPGDGSEAIVTDWPGVPYDPALAKNAYVAHLYSRVGTVPVRVDTTWSAQFRIDGRGAFQDVDGTVTMPGRPVQVEVREAGAVLTGS
jgi:hypothetical protein